MRVILLFISMNMHKIDQVIVYFRLTHSFDGSMIQLVSISICISIRSNFVTVE